VKLKNWQGKEMRNLGRCIPAVSASALRNLESSQSHDIKTALKYVSTLVDFAIMAQYHSHTPDILVYMERYLQTFQRTKDIFLEFSTSKATCAEANRWDRNPRELMTNQRVNEAQHNTAAKRRRQVDEGRLERANLRADWIRCENLFNFIKMHYLSHFAFHVRHIWVHIDVFYRDR